ncbi:hypothetical protein ES702_05888 [subsurface metagenome]
MPDYPEYNIQDYTFPLAVARTEVELHTGLSNCLVISKFDDINSLFTIRFGDSSAPAKFAIEGLRIYFDKYFQKIYMSNIAGVGNIEFTVSKEANVYMPARFMGDMTNIAILEQQIAIGAAATPIPAVAMVGRKKILVVCIGANPVELGSATVTFGTGIPLPVNAVFGDDITQNVILYGIAAVGGIVRCLESS